MRGYNLNRHIETVWFVCNVQHTRLGLFAGERVGPRYMRIEKMGVRDRLSEISRRARLRLSICVADSSKVPRKNAVVLHCVIQDAIYQVSILPLQFMQESAENLNVLNFFVGIEAK